MVEMFESATMRIGFVFKRVITLRGCQSYGDLLSSKVSELYVVSAD